MNWPIYVHRQIGMPMAKFVPPLLEKRTCLGEPRAQSDWHYIARRGDDEYAEVEPLARVAQGTASGRVEPRGGTADGAGLLKENGLGLTLPAVKDRWV